MEKVIWKGGECHLTGEIQLILDFYKISSIFKEEHNPY